MNPLDNFPEMTYRDLRPFKFTAVLKFQKTGAGAEYPFTSSTEPVFPLFSRSFYYFDNVEVSGTLPKYIFEAVNEPTDINNDPLNPEYVPNNFNMRVEPSTELINLERIPYGTYGVKPLGMWVNNSQDTNDAVLKILDDTRTNFKAIPISLDYDEDTFYIYLTFSGHRTTNKEFIAKYVQQGSELRFRK